MKLYDQILSKYNDANRYIREELTAMSGGNQNNNNTKATGKESLQLLQEFVDFHRLESTAARNLMLIESLEKKLDSVALELFNEANPRPEGVPRPDEVVRMYDLQLSTKNEMTELEEQYRKTTGNADSLFPHLSADLEACKAARALYVGLSYVDENKFAEATALFDRLCNDHKRPESCTLARRLTITHLLLVWISSIVRSVVGNPSCTRLHSWKR